jgi:hypothetical protein
MYVETTKKLAQAIFLFSACSLCVILLCVTAATRHNATALRSVNYPVYTYQNPFSLTDSASATAYSKTKAGNVLSKLVSFKSFLGLSGLGALWLASTWYLQRGWPKRKRIHRKVRYAITYAPAKMNPLATLPKPIMRVTKQDIIRPAVLCQTNTRCSFAHRKTTAPCQSRFRPITLVSSQTRFGRL